MIVSKICTVEDCGRIATTNSSAYCSMHYTRLRRHGDVSIVKKAGGKITHGMTHTSMYSTWHGMVNRSTDPNHKRYKDYGHLGIDTRWVKGDGKLSGFECFLKDMGKKPNGLTLDRIDNYQGYYKDNCRWASASDQMHHQKPRKGKVPYRGVWLKKDNVKKYAAGVTYKYTSIKLGAYETAEEAALAYDCAVIQLRGEFAETNIL